MTNKIALITGANKGIGFEIAKQLGKQGITVLIGSRDKENGAKAVDELVKLGITAQCIELDVTNEVSIKQASEKIKKDYGHLDILVNNAGISGGASLKPSEIDAKHMRHVYETNVFGVVSVTKAMLPLILKSPAGRIVNATSGLGSLTLSSGQTSEFGNLNDMAYQSSKAALNFITIAYAKELKDTPIKVNAADPGFTATDFNNQRGYRTVEQGATTAVRLATLDNDGSTGTFQDENGIVPW
jgi:NAD(P)-dependent dehydrogenase (short-subunit alcohol dehydrogenase family)